MSRYLVTMSTLVLLLALAFALSPSVPSVAALDSISISGTVYYDEDLDSGRDPGEPPAAGVEVDLLGPKVGQVGSTQTDADGKYRFDAPNEEGVYQIMAVANGCSANGFYSNYPGADASTNRFDIGLPPPGEGTVAGILWEDRNENGVRDSGEDGLAEWYVYLFTALPFTPDRTPMLPMFYCGHNAYTGPGGEYTFDALSPIPYYEIGVQGPVADIYDPTTLWEVTSPLTPVADSPFGDHLRPDAKADLMTDSSHNIDIGVHLLIGTGTISGSLFHDLNNDTHDEAEPLVKCSGPFALVGFYRRAPSLGTLDVLPFARCEDDGRFRIERIPAGQYNAGQYFCHPLGGASARPLQPWVTVHEGETVEGIKVQGCPSALPLTPTRTPETPAAPVDSSETPGTVAAPQTGSGPADGQSRILQVLLLAIGISGLTLGSCIFALRKGQKKRLA